MSRRTGYRILSALGAVSAVQRGPSAVAKREVRRATHRQTARLLRKVLK